jgi:hypothetical protein
LSPASSAFCGVVVNDNMAQTLDTSTKSTKSSVVTTGHDDAPDADDADAPDDMASEVTSDVASGASNVPMFRETMSAAQFVKMLRRGGYADMPQPQAAEALGMCLTRLKQLCRTKGVRRWPYRARQSLKSLRTKLVQYLGCAAAARIAHDALRRLQRMEDALAEVPEHVHTLRQVVHKLEHTVRVGRGGELHRVIADDPALRGKLLEALHVFRDADIATMTTTTATMTATATIATTTATTTATIATRL